MDVWDRNKYPFTEGSRSVIHERTESWPPEVPPTDGLIYFDRSFAGSGNVSVNRDTVLSKWAHGDIWFVNAWIAAGAILRGYQYIKAFPYNLGTFSDLINQTGPEGAGNMTTGINIVSTMTSVAFQWWPRPNPNDSFQIDAGYYFGTGTLPGTPLSFTLYTRAVRIAQGVTA
jgi:hypothetical protein